MAVGLVPQHHTFPFFRVVSRYEYVSLAELIGLHVYTIASTCTSTRMACCDHARVRRGALAERP